jgi:hypothetical protein
MRPSPDGRVSSIPLATGTGYTTYMPLIYHLKALKRWGNKTVFIHNKGKRQLAGPVKPQYTRAPLSQYGTEATTVMATEAGWGEPIRMDLESVLQPLVRNYSRRGRLVRTSCALDEDSAELLLRRH